MLAGVLQLANRPMSCDHLRAPEPGVRRGSPLQLAGVVQRAAWVEAAHVCWRHTQGLFSTLKAPPSCGGCLAKLRTLLKLLLGAAWDGGWSSAAGVAGSAVMGGRWCLECEAPCLDPLFPR